MEQFWRSLGAWLGTHRLQALGVLLAVTAVLGIGARRLEFATGQDSYLNPDSQVAIDNVAIQEQFGGETVIMLLTATDGADVSSLFEGRNLATLEHLHAELAAIDEVEAVITPLTALEWSSRLVGGGAAAAALTAALTREPDEAGRQARTADITTSLARLQAAPNQQIGDPAWNELLLWANGGYTVGADGSVVAPPVVERSIRLSLRSTFPADGVAVGGVVLAGNATLDEQSAGTGRVLDVFATAELDGFELTVTGSPVYLREINEYLKGGMARLGIVALAVMVVVLLVMFRVRKRLLPLLAVILGVLWAFSVLGWIGIDLSLMTISGLPILIGLGIVVAIVVHSRVEEEVLVSHRAHPLAETMANLGPPVFVAVVTGVLAFAALRISKVPMIRDFGVLLAVGVVMLAVVGLVVPIVGLGVKPSRAPSDPSARSAIERAAVRLGSLPSGLAPPIAVASAILFVTGVATAGDTPIESDPIRWIDQHSEVVRDVRRLEEETGFSSTLGVLVEANNVLDQSVIDVLHDFTIVAEADPGVVTTSSVTNTIAKLIQVPGATDLAPTPSDLANAIAVMPPDIRAALVDDDLTATQVNLRLAPAALDARAVLVERLRTELDARIATLDLPADSVLLTGLPADQPPIRAVPAGLAMVGVGLLESLEANRAWLTYLALAAAAVYLVLRLRSVARAVLALVPVLLAIGLSALVVGLAGLELSPLTTVSGPLVIAAVAEFSVLLLARYVEEREHGLTPPQAHVQASARTGRALLTSAATTIGGCAVLVASTLPLLRDFGVIVTLNIAIALFAALVVVPPSLVWVDEHGWLPVAPQPGSVRLAAPATGRQYALAMGAAYALCVATVAIYVSSDTSSGSSLPVAYAAVELPTTTTTTTTTTTPPTTTVPGAAPSVPAVEPGGPVVDPSTFGSDRPASVVGGVLFDRLTEQGVAPNVAVCAVETLFSRVSEADLLAAGIATFSDEALAPAIQASLDCGIGREIIDAAIAAQRGN